MKSKGPTTTAATSSSGTNATTDMQIEQSTPPPKPFSTPPLVAETLQYRLDTGIIAKSGGQRGSLTRCAQKYGVFAFELQKDTPDAEQIEVAKGELIQDLKLYQLEMTKLWLKQQISNQELQASKQETKEREDTIEKEEILVQQANEQAKRARESRNCFLEYEALAKLANDNHSQPRRSLEQQIITVKEDLKQLQQEMQSIDKTFRVREAQFQLLIEYMLDLKRTLKDDDTKDGDGNDNITSGGGGGGGSTATDTVKASSNDVGGSTKTKKKGDRKQKEDRSSKRAKLRKDDDEEGAIAEENSTQTPMKVDEGQKGDGNDVLYDDL